MLAHVVDHMATKDDVRAIVRDELAPIRSELKSIRRDLDDLREKVENVIGFQKKSITRLSASPPSKSTSASPRKSPPNRPQPRHHRTRQWLCNIPVQIDTSTAATDTIAYVVTDSLGLIGSSTRTVLIERSVNARQAPSAASDERHNIRHIHSTIKLRTVRGLLRICDVAVA